MTVRWTSRESGVAEYRGSSVGWMGLFQSQLIDGRKLHDLKWFLEQQEMKCQAR